MAKRKKINSLYNRYYKWLTSCENFHELAVGNDVKDFCIFGDSEVDPHNDKEKDVYLKKFEYIALGIINSITKNDFLDSREYIRYQLKSVEKIFNTKVNLRDKRMRNLCSLLFDIQDLDNDGKLGVQDLAVALVYLDYQDGILNGKIRYEDAITLGYNLEMENSATEMKTDLNKIKSLLY